MLTRLVATFVAVSIMVSPVSSQEADVHEAQVDALFEVLALPQMIDIMAREGTEYGGQIATDLIPGGATRDWTRIVAGIYDTDHMELQVRAAFAGALEDVDVTPILVFFEAEPGRTIIDLEISAREAMLDDAVEEASKEMAAIAMADETDRFLLVEEFVTLNDLIETNIVGALNSNFAFYQGLASGGAFDQTLTEQQILADVWSQEPQIRQNTTEWVYSFLLMAYQPLPDADVQAYIAFSETPSGAALNRAIFFAFDGMFKEISGALGRATAGQMITQEL